MVSDPATGSVWQPNKKLEKMEKEIGRVVRSSYKYHKKIPPTHKGLIDTAVRYAMPVQKRQPNHEYIILTREHYGKPWTYLPKQERCLFMVRMGMRRGMYVHIPTSVSKFGSKKKGMLYRSRPSLFTTRCTVDRS